MRKMGNMRCEATSIRTRLKRAADKVPGAGASEGLCLRHGLLRLLLLCSVGLTLPEKLRPERIGRDAADERLEDLEPA
jgi:hypothetical protein